MKHRMTLRMIGAYIISFVCAFFSVAALCSENFKSTAFQDEAYMLRRECSYIASEYVSSYEQSSLTLADFESHLEALTKYAGADVYIVSTDGTVLVTNTASTLYSESSVIEDFSLAGMGGKFYGTGDFFGLYSEEMLIVYGTITRNGRASGYVIMTKPLDEVYATGEAYMEYIYSVLPVILAFSAIIFIVFLFTINRPLRKLMKTAAKYAKGDYKERIETKRRDEIGDLSRTVDFMARELDSLEGDQRKLISNISHDFRSPLTSIKGYAGAMKDGTIPPEMYDKYLDTIIFQADRLEKLTEGLRELNKYGSSGMILTIRDYDINAQIRRVVQSFEMQAKEKRISFNLILTGDELFVHADEDKIERVLMNLIDNAMKFSGQNSEIKIENSVIGGKVRVSVRDEGIGIPKDQIGKVWERFYKIDTSRGKDQKGSGLGLSIVREIITAHKENINVISTEGVGTEFIFTLTVAGEE